MSHRTEDAPRTLLENEGYEVESPARLEGVSGVLHDFALCAKKAEENEIAIEVENSGRPLLISILSLYAKALDTNLGRLLLITDAPMTEEAKHLAELYNIRILPLGISANQWSQLVRASCTSAEAYADGPTAGTSRSMSESCKTDLSRSKTKQ